MGNLFTAFPKLSEHLVACVCSLLFILDSMSVILERLLIVLSNDPKWIPSVVDLWTIYNGSEGARRGWMHHALDVCSARLR